MIASKEEVGGLTGAAKQGVLRRPSFRWSDIWKAPLHDFPIRDEILYQYLPLSPDMDVLEIGPGSGFTAFRLAREVRSLTLVDVAAENIRQLQSDLRDRQNLRFLRADIGTQTAAERLEGGFDAICGLEVFEYIEHPGTCLRNLATALRPGGWLLLQWPNYHPPERVGAVTCLRSRGELGELMRDAGFQEWDVYALKLRPYASFLFKAFHEQPLRFHRMLNNRKDKEHSQSCVYDQTWAFRNRSALDDYKALLHGFWAVLGAAIKVAGNCFEREQLHEEIVNRNLLLMARK